MVYGTALFTDLSREWNFSVLSFCMVALVAMIDRYLCIFKYT